MSQMQATKNKVEEKYLIPIARELAIGLNAVHKACIIHRDVKGTVKHPRNVEEILDMDFKAYSNTDRICAFQLQM